MSADAKPLTTSDVEDMPCHDESARWYRITCPNHVFVRRDDLLATTRALETAVAELDSARFARDRYANTIGLIESAIGFSGASPVEETIERVRRLKAERDSAITRAEKAESERDEARGEARAHRAALDDATAACHGLGCGRCEDCVSLQRERAEKAEAERYIALAKAKWAAS